MNVIRQALLAVPLLLLSACGGSKGSVSPQSFQGATPSYGALSMDQVGALDTTPLLSGVAVQPLIASTGEALLIQGSACEPHLFLRAREVVERVDRHLYKALRHAEYVVSSAPGVTAGASRVWEGVNADGVRVKLTVTSLAPSQFGWELQLGLPGATAFETVLSGEIDRTGATQPHQGKGSLDVDFARLHQIYPADPTTQGALHLDFDTRPASRKLAVLATGMVWEVRDDGLGLDAATLLALEAPRSGSYVYFREPGIGGSLKVEDQMVFACPANPTLALADAKLVSRWYRTAAGEVHGRTDALVSGGQFGQEDLVGVTCHGAASELTLEQETFWLAKDEDSSGATVSGESSESLGGVTSAACDPVLGQAPALASAAADFAWDPALRFDDGVPFPFPGMR
ncbi:MAG TPA: hypothetical protein VFE30_16795 [Anaeromyxobacteraceae bacterium]|jgi:hypothetical protein|nr:hypothetical protein [Anaeromyxobacteraceae bacterium]